MSHSSGEPLKPGEKDGNELLDEQAKYTNLDRFFDRNPANLTKEDKLELLKGMRYQRAQFHIKEQEKKDKVKS
jgi:hypothetical protein